MKYEDVKAINNSLLNELERDLKNAENMWNGVREQSDEKVHFQLGTLVDEILSGTLNKKDYIFSEVSPSEKLVQLVDTLLLRNLSFKEEILKEAVPLSLNLKTFPRVTSKATAEKKIKENADIILQSYFLIRRAKESKKIVRPMQMLEDAQKIAYSLMHGKYTEKYFKDSSAIGNQIEIYSTYNTPYGTVPIKGKIDRIINPKNKVIGIDFKTMWDHPSSFEDSYVKWKYYRQGSFYCNLISQKYSRFSNDFVFVAQTTTNTFNLPEPLDFKMHIDDIICAKVGCEPYIGWEQLLIEMAWRIKYNDFVTPRTHLPFNRGGNVLNKLRRK